MSKRTSDFDLRMKNYEQISSHKLLPKVPVIIRLDGKAFHTLTRGMKRPFDDQFIECMHYTTQSLVRYIEGCEFAYTQSDEISLLLTDYSTILTQPWFDYKITKLVSVTSSMATAFFNKNFSIFFPDKQPAFFDSRAFNLPKHEVVNYFYHRQLDATRNSIQAVGQANFSVKQLHGKSCDQIQEMLWQEKNINWNDIETHKKRGTCVYRYVETRKSQFNEYDICLNCKTGKLKRNPNNIEKLKCDLCGVELPLAISSVMYYIDKDIPIFSKNREYVEKFVKKGN